MCSGCGQPAEQCTCRANKSSSVSGPVRVRLETKGRKGKAVTVVTGIPLDHLELADLGKKLKQKCGAGGTVKEGVIEIQGDHRASVISALKDLDYNPKN